MTKNTKNRTVGGAVAQAKILQLERALAKMTAQKQQVKKQLTPLGVAFRDLGNIGTSFFGMGKVFGEGAYKLQQNSMMKHDAATGRQVPFMHSSDESVIFRHREFISDIKGSQDFNAIQVKVNPGLSDVFPYLSAIAGNFQEYRFRGLIFEFKSTSATSITSGTNTAMGYVALAAQYRADAPGFTSKQQLLNEMWSVDCKPSDNVILPIECAPSETPLKFQYIRDGDVVDYKFYDLCSVTIATGGMQATGVVQGELWASYEIELKKPRVDLLSPAATAGSAHYRLVAPIAAAPLAGAVEVSDTIGTFVLGTTQLQFPNDSASYYVQYAVYGSPVAGVVYPSFSGFGGLSIETANNFTGGSSNELRVPGGGGAAERMSSSFIVRILEGPLGTIPTLAFGVAGTFPTGVTLGDLVITGANYAFA